MRPWKVAFFAVAVALFMAASAFAQPGGGGGGGRGGRGGGQGGPGGGRGNFDPAQFQQRMMERMKEQLGATDDEWKVLQPKVEKVMQAQRDARGGGFGGFGGRGGRGGPGGDNQPQSELAKASAELRAVLENRNASAEEISAKLKAFRDARDKAQAVLEAAQKELKELLTARQEAILVRDGMLR